MESKTTLAGLREMEEKDLPQVADLFRRYMQRFDMAPLMNFEEVKHHLLSGRGEGEFGDGGKGRRKGQVTWSYVVEVSFFLFFEASMLVRASNFSTE